MTRPRRYLLALLLAVLFTVNPWPAEGGLPVCHTCASADYGFANAPKAEGGLGSVLPVREAGR